MVEVGDRVELETERVGQLKRCGVVTGVRDRLVVVRWDDGHESSLMPMAGALRVVEPAREREPAAT